MSIRIDIRVPEDTLARIDAEAAERKMSRTAVLIERWNESKGRPGFDRPTMGAPTPGRDEDIAWAAGLFEGEGCFSRTDRSGRQPKRSARIESTDQDVLDRFCAVVGVGKVSPMALRDPRWKPSWRWEIQSFEGVQAVGTMLWKHLGPRRRNRLAEVLADSEGSTPSRSTCEHARARVLRLKTCTECGARM